MGFSQYLKFYMQKPLDLKGKKAVVADRNRPATNLGFNLLPQSSHGIVVDRRFVVTSGSALLLAPSPLVLASGAASTMRLHDHGPYTRLVLELSKGVEFSIFQLGEPYRIVVDLPELDWAIVGDAATESTGLVKTVRYGLFQPGNARIVIDLAHPSGVKNAFVLPPTGNTPFRFVLDMEPVSRESFMANVGQRHRKGALDMANVKPDAERTNNQVSMSRTDGVPGTDRKALVVLDPGHGGVDPGAIGVSGIYEKVITLAAARQLKALLENTGRYDVILTRDRDISLAHRERREIARRVQADVFMSIHADSIGNKDVRGLSVYTLSEKASDKEAAALAERENNADLIIGMDLSRESDDVRHILVDLAQRESMNLATKLATKLIIQLQRDVKLLRNTHRFAGFAVLKSPDIPSVLIEMGYLSNREDERALRRPQYRKKLMAAVARGLDDHIGVAQSARTL